MTRAQMHCWSFLSLALIALAMGCGDDSPSDVVDDHNLPSNTPAVPVPGSPNELLPSVSETFIVGLSSPLAEFVPIVHELCMMQDDGSEPWLTLDLDRRLILACADVLPRNCNIDGAPDATYISDRPRLMHTRHWRKIKQVTLDPGTTYSHEETITYGTSTSHSESQSFSQTIGVEVTAEGDWGPFSASVSASFEQTTTHEEINAITFSVENTFTDTYSSGDPRPSTIVYAIWQLVDCFVLVDADSLRIDESPTLLHARILETPDILFPNRDAIYESVTVF